MPVLGTYLSLNDNISQFTTSFFFYHISYFILKYETQFVKRDTDNGSTLPRFILLPLQSHLGNFYKHHEVKTIFTGNLL